MAEIGTLVALDVPPGAPMESLSGLQMARPRIYGRTAGDGDPAFVLIHPASNFHGHYLVGPLAGHGATVLALNTRYVANDSMLVMERAMLDLGAGVRWLRRQGHRRVVLVGNSGGGALVALYQSQAERLTITDTPDGRPLAATPEDLPPADAIALVAAHPGRAATLSEWIDPAVTDEQEPLATDPGLDLYADDRAVPLDRDWLAGYRAAQRERLARITAWVEQRLQALNRERIADQAFTIHRTMADPRFVDTTIEPSDRRPGTAWGDPAAINFAANGLARFTTLRSFLSQWSPAHTRADGPARLAETSVPVLNAWFRGDQLVFPSHAQAWNEAAGDRLACIEFPEANHYPQSTPGVVETLARELIDWAAGLPA